MKRTTWALWMAVLLGSSACSSPQLEAGPSHPASTEAPRAALTPVGSALEPNFEPQTAALQSAPAPAEHEHAHGAATHGAAAHEPAAEKKAAPAATQWTCPMHPEIIRSEPGNCPICGMKLKPVPPKDGVKGAP